MEYNAELVDETISWQIDLIEAKIVALESNMYKLSQPVALVGLRNIKKNKSEFWLDWDASDGGAPQYDRVFYCFFMDMIFWLDKRLELIGLIEDHQTQTQWETLENRRAEVEIMLDLIATDEDEDPYGTVLNEGYDKALGIE